MILLVVVIYFIILAVIEFIFILMSRNNKKNNINLEAFEDIKIDNVIESNNLILNKSNKNVNIPNYIGKFYLTSHYGFYTNLDKFHLLESKKLYEFNIPVNIKLVKIDEKTDLVYYCNIEIEPIEKNIENIEILEILENVENVENVEILENIEILENVENVENVESNE